MTEHETYLPYQRRRPSTFLWVVFVGGFLSLAWLAWSTAGEGEGETEHNGGAGSLFGGQEGGLSAGNVDIPCGGWAETMVTEPESLQPFVTDPWLALRGGRNLEALALVGGLEDGLAEEALAQRAWVGVAGEFAAARDLALRLQVSYLDARLAHKGLSDEHRAVFSTLRASAALQGGDDLKGGSGDILAWLDVGEQGALAPLAGALRLMVGEELDPDYRLSTAAALRWVSYLPALSEALAGQGDCPFPHPGVGGSRLAELSMLLSNPEEQGDSLKWVADLNPFRPDLTLGHCDGEPGLEIGIFEPWTYTALSAFALEQALSRDGGDGQSAFLTLDLYRLVAPDRAAEDACRLLESWPPQTEAGISPYLVHGDWSGVPQQTRFLRSLCDGEGLNGPCPAELNAARARNAQVLEQCRDCYRRVREADPDAGRFLEQWRAYAGPARRSLLRSVLGGGCLPEVTTDTYQAWRMKVDGSSRWEDRASNLSLLASLGPRDFRELAPKEIERLARAHPIYAPLREILRRQGATGVLGGGVDQTISGGTTDLPTITTSGG